MRILMEGNSEVVFLSLVQVHGLQDAWRGSRLVYSKELAHDCEDRLMCGEFAEGRVDLG
jgi:hypothetical protein